MSSPFATKLPSIDGGLPTSVDLGPSILFTVLYFGALSITVWRAWTYRKPISLLFSIFRLNIFIFTRLISFIIRAIEAHQASQGVLVPSTQLFVAEQILLSIGYIALVSQLVGLVRSHLGRTDVSSEGGSVGAGASKSRWSLKNLSSVMNVALMVAVILGIVAGAKYSTAVNDPSVAAQITTFRIVSAVISLVVTVISILIALFLLSARPHLPRRGSAYLVLCGCVLVIVPAYRASSLSNSQTTLAELTSVKTKVEFWVLQATMEWIVLMLCLAVDIRIWFGAGGEEARLAMKEHNVAAPGMRMGPMGGQQTMQSA